MAMPLIIGGIGLAFLMNSSVETGTEPVTTKQPPIQPAKPNPVLQREWENQVPGRYDNLPQLQCVNKDPAYMLDPNVVGQMNYEGQRNASTLMERQHTLLEPGVTPLGLGVLPRPTKGSGVMLPDPLTGDEFKPQKRENRDVDMFMPQGDILVQRTQANYVNQQMRIEQLETKRQSGHGAMDSYTFQPDLPQGAPGSCCEGFQSLGNQDAVRNFATGEVMIPREGGRHPRQRIFRVPETQRGRVAYSLRPGNPTQATAHPNSIYQRESAPLGEIELARNADVSEWWRTPLPEGGARQGAPAGRSMVAMQTSNRDVGPCSPRQRKLMAAADAPSYSPNDIFDSCDRGSCAQVEGSTQIQWAGPGGREGIAQEARRILNQYVRPKYTTNSGIRCEPTASMGVTRGGYEVTDYSQDLCEKAPQRMTMEENVNKQPAPHNPRGNNAAFSYFTDQRQTLALKTTDGRAGGPQRADNEVADGASRTRFYDVVPRDTMAKQTGVEMECIHAPNGNRSLAMQRPEQYFEPISRRVTPWIEVAPAYEDTQAYRSCPYTIPLPSAPATDFF
jgi:hypothetical protein